MTGRRTEDLIVTLATDAAPVARLAPVGRRTWRWVGGTAALTAAAAWAIGPRPDLAVALRNPDFLSGLLFMLGTGLVGAAAAFALSVPGAERTRLERWLPIAIAIGWMTSLVTRLLVVNGTWRAVIPEPWHPACGARMLLFAAVPAAAAVVMIHRAAPLQPVWAATMAALAALGFAAAAVQAVCPFDSPAHLIVAHALPFVLLAVVGAWVGSRLLRFSTESV